MLVIKSAQYDDFRDSTVRSLHGRLLETKAHTDQALQLFDALLAAGRFDLTIDDIQKNHDLRYAIEWVYGAGGATT